MKEWNKATHWMTDANGNKLKSGKDLKMRFLEMYAAGWRVIPVGDCHNFDYQEGCLCQSSKTNIKQKKNGKQESQSLGVPEKK
jgi:hypothetical protein